MKKSLNEKPKCIQNTCSKIKCIVLSIILCVAIYSLSGNDPNDKRWFSLHGVAEVLDQLND